MMRMQRRALTSWIGFGWRGLAFAVPSSCSSGPTLNVCAVNPRLPKLIPRYELAWGNTLRKVCLLVIVHGRLCVSLSFCHKAWTSVCFFCFYLRNESTQFNAWVSVSTWRRRAFARILYGSMTTGMRQPTTSTQCVKIGKRYCHAPLQAELY